MWKKFPVIGHDYTAYMDYMDLDMSCPRKAIKLNHSLTEGLEILYLTVWLYFTVIQYMATELLYLCCRCHGSTW